MQVVSPTPEIVEIMAPMPSVPGLSWEDLPVLFEESVMLGDEGIRREDTATSGELLLTL